MTMFLRTMRLPCTILFLAMAWVCHAQPTNCKDFHNGTFRIDDAEHGTTTIITRKGGKQRERLGDRETTLKVVWINDCTYTLEPLKTKSRKNTTDMDLGIDPSFVIKVEILETGADHYIQRSTAALYDLVYTSRVERVR